MTHQRFIAAITMALVMLLAAGQTSVTDTTSTSLPMQEIGDVGGRVLIGDGLFPRAGKYKTVFRSLLWWRRYGAVFESSTMSKSKETIFFRFLV